MELEALEDRSLLSGNFGSAFSIGSNDAATAGVIESGRSIAIGSDGSTLVAFNFRGVVDANPLAGFTTSLDSGGAAVRAVGVAKYDSAGLLVWARSFAASDVDAGGIATDPNGNVYLAGTFVGSGDFDPGAGTTTLESGLMGTVASAFVVKLDSDGVFSWAAAVSGTSYVNANAIAVDESGNLVVAGGFAGTADFDPDPMTTDNQTADGVFGTGPSAVAGTAFVMRLSTSGTLAWANTFGGSGYSHAYGVDINGAGDVLMAGVFSGTIDADSGIGSTTLTTAGATENTDAFVVRLNSNGELTWASSVGGAGGNSVTAPTEGATGVRFDPAGAALVSGLFSGTADFKPGPLTSNLVSAGQSDAFALKLDQDGGLLWAARFGSTGADSANAVATDANHDAYFTGSFRGTVDFNPGAGTTNLTSAGLEDVFVLRLRENGTLSWARRMGGTRSDSGSAIAVSDSSDVFTTGSFSGTADFDPGAGVSNLVAAGSASQDIYVSRLLQTGAGYVTASISATDATSAEVVSGQPADTGTFRISRTGSTFLPLTVSFARSGTATSGSDYTLSVNGTPTTAASVTIPAGASFIDVVVTPIDDRIQEPTESVILTLAATANYSLDSVPANRTATVSLADNEPQVTINAVDAGAAETRIGQPVDTATFRITRVGNTSGNLLVLLTHTGTATFGATGDYTLSGGAVNSAGTQVTIPDGLDFVDLVVAPRDDTVAELTETVIFTIGASTLYHPATLPADRAATATIADNEAALTITATDATATESPTSPPPDTATFRITRTAGVQTLPLTVNFSRGGTATFGATGDYTLRVGLANLPGTSVVIPANQSFVDVTVVPVNNTIGEPTETVTLTLAASAAYSLPALAANRTASASIIDDEPVVSITAPDAVGTETTPSETPDPGTFRISRTGDTTNDLIVKVLRTGTATATTDFTLSGPNANSVTATTVRIPAGSAFVDISVNVVDNFVVEPNETVVMTLVANTAAYWITPTVAQRTATVTVVDNEPFLSIASFDNFSTETRPGDPADTGTVRISRTGSTEFALNVNFTTGGTSVRSTATVPADFSLRVGATTITGNTVTIPAGDDFVDVTIVPRDDALAEADAYPYYEVASITLAAATSYVIPTTVGNRTAGVLIIDNEPFVSIAAQTPTAVEGPSGQAVAGIFRVTRTGPTTSPLTVNVVRSGTATFGATGDFTLSGGSVNATGTQITIPVGADHVDVSVNPVDNLLAEPNETVVMTLGASGTYNRSTTPSERNATVTILDDEPTVSITRSAATVSEDATAPETFTISRSGSTTGDLLVKFSVSGTAIAGTDYVAFGGSQVVIPAGASSVTLDLHPRLDTLNEATPETVTVALAASTAYKLPSLALDRISTISIVNSSVGARIGTDLVGLSLTSVARTFSRTATTGSFTMSTSVRNQGDTAAGAGSVSASFYLSSDRTLDTGLGGDFLLGTSTLAGAINAGASMSISLARSINPHTFFSGLSPGSYYVIVAINFTGTDTDTSNNTVVSLLNNFKITV